MQGSYHAPTSSQTPGIAHNFLPSSSPYFTYSISYAADMTMQPAPTRSIGSFFQAQGQAENAPPPMRAKTPGAQTNGSTRPLNQTRSGVLDRTQAGPLSGQVSSQTGSDVDAQFETLGDEVFAAVDQAGAETNFYTKQSNPALNSRPIQPATANHGSIVQVGSRLPRTSYGPAPTIKPAVHQPMQSNEIYSGISATARATAQFKPPSPGKQLPKFKGFGPKRMLDDVAAAQQDTRPKRNQVFNQDYAVDAGQQHDGMQVDYASEQHYTNDVDYSQDAVQQPVAAPRGRKMKNHGQTKMAQVQAEPAKPKEVFTTANHFHDPKAFLRFGINPTAIWEQVLARHDADDCLTTGESAREALQKLADEAEQKLAVGFQRGLEVAQYCNQMTEYKNQVIERKQAISQQYTDASWDLANKCKQLAANTQLVKTRPQKVLRGTTPGVRSTPETGMPAAQGSTGLGGFNGFSRM